MSPTILLTADTIAARVHELGREISERHRGESVVLVAVLKGSFVFAADLARAIDDSVTVEVEFMSVRSYGDSTETSGVVQITSDLTRSIEGKRVILVEDIVDTGLTMAYLLENLRTRGPASLELASLLHKPARARTPVHIDYLGFTIDDVFVVGYGLDHAQRLRNLPYLGVLEES
ncbi:MAG: hypoxanthine phosphoribosyltransferase [Myxococcales bacterium]|nr:hypoxanthine phosphoribosyltransferase [Myxococcales bacterium]MCB9628657.1 hypoxanthine phosphoribosyltransferase [Sandaracinaceae bacterium]